jgi:serine/threonine protein kinase
VARLVRRYDDEALTLGVPAWADLLTSPGLPGQPLSTADEPAFIAHLDITPENVVFGEGEATALIDFDLARPATRAEEVANMLLWWAPWMPVDDREDVLRSVDPFARARLLVDAYDLDDASRARLVDVSRNIADRSWWSMRHRAETLGGGWRRMWDDGVGDRILRRQVWLAANADALADAVA